MREYASLVEALIHAVGNAGNAGSHGTAARATGGLLAVTGVSTGMGWEGEGQRHVPDGQALLNELLRTGDVPRGRPRVAAV